MLRLASVRVLCALAALGAVMALTLSSADARQGGGMGSRGSRTFSAPPSTNTAPGGGGAINRSMTQPGTAAQRPGMAPQQPAGGGFFNRPGLLGGLAAGFLGAGLLGMLMGHGFGAGLGGIASLFGLLIQIALFGGIAYLVWSWWQRRSQPAMAGGPSYRDMQQDGRPPLGLGALGGGSAAPMQPQQGSDEVGIGPDDYNAFEHLLEEIQTAYAREDLAALRARVTPEMLSYFSEELSEHASRGVVSQTDDVKLLQGDLAEAWREGNVEYATVAMRYSMRDRLVERASGRVVEGSADQPVVVTELWTFLRSPGGKWLLTAIQEA